MKARLLSTIQVSDNEVRALAYDWALKVKDYLQETGKIKARRLFLLEANPRWRRGPGQSQRKRRGPEAQIG